MLEMSSEYSPELSNFKSAVVMCVTPTTNTVRLRYTEGTVEHEKERGQWVLDWSNVEAFLNKKDEGNLLAHSYISDHICGCVLLSVTVINY